MRSILPFALAFVAALPTSAQSTATFNQRAQIVLNSIPNTAAAIESGHHIQYQLWAAESLYLKGYDSEAKTLLLSALPNMHEPATPSDDAFNLIAAVDVMERWSSHFTPTPDPNPSQNLNTVYQSTLTGFQYWNSASTSNQVLMAAVARYLAYEKYPTATFASNFAANDPNARTFLLCYMTQLETHNTQEYDSDVYSAAYLLSIRLLADYAQDATVKQAAQLTYDWLITNAASTWLNSTWAATSYRRYFDIAPQNQMETGSWTLWPLFGGPAPGSGFNVELMQGALQTIATCQCATGYIVEDGTAYVPRQEIMDLLAWSSAPGSPAAYEFKARTYTPSKATYQYMQDSFIAQNYALFGEADFETASGTKLALQPPSQVLSGVVWNPSSANAAYPSNFYAGAPRWQVDFTPTTPVGCSNSSADCAVANHTFGFGQHGQYFQSGNAQLGVYNYNITTTDPEPNQFYIYAPLCTNNQYPYPFTSSTTIPSFPCTTATVPRALLTSETSTLGHLYLFYDNVLISLWLSAPFTWDGLHELTAYDPSTLNAHSLLASAMEVASPATFAGANDAATLANFATYVDTHASFNTTGLTGATPSATYTTSSGVVMQNTFQGQNVLNGTTVNYANWPFLQTPWVHQDWLTSVACVSCYAGQSFNYPGIGGGGNLTVTSPITGNQLVYNFSNETVIELLAQTITLTPVATPAAVGATASLSATATSGLPITYSVSGPATLSGTTVTYTGAGTVTITATQAGNSNYLPATASQNVKVINNTGTILTYTPAVPTYGSTVTLTATVTPVAGSTPPTGSVAFYDSAQFLGSGIVSSNVARYATSGLSVGSHAVTAVYGGDGNYAPSTSPPTTLTIAALPTSISFTATPTTAPVGTIIHLSVTVSPSSGSTVPAGTVTFFDGTSSLGNATLNNYAQATFSANSLALGVHTLTASYAANGILAASTATQTVTITGPPDFSVTPGTTALTVAGGSSATSTLLITPLNTYTGTVTFSCGTGLPSSSICAIAPSTLSFLPSLQTPQTATLTVTVAASHASLAPSALTLAFLGLPLALIGMRRKRISFAALLCIAVFTTVTGCSNETKSDSVPHGSYTTTITATDGVNTHSFNLNVTIP